MAKNKKVTFVKKTLTTFTLDVVFLTAEDYELFKLFGQKLFLIPPFYTKGKLSCWASSTIDTRNPCLYDRVILRYSTLKVCVGHWGTAVQIVGFAICSYRVILNRLSCSCLLMIRSFTKEIEC